MLGCLRCFHMKLCCCCLLYLLVTQTLTASVDLPPNFNASINQFITDLTAIQKNRNYLRYSWIRKTYILFDSFHTPSTYRNVVRQPIKIFNFNLTAAISNHYRRLYLNSPSPNLVVSVLYYRNTEPSALIRSIRATEHWTGSQTMHIVHEIIQRLGVWDVSLVNAARFWYDIEDDEGEIHKAFIPLIELRCIRGMTTDWYSEFGYFNCVNDSIACQMQALYNLPVYDHRGCIRDMTLGPFLYNLWNRSDKNKFHKEYRKVSEKFKCLKILRDEGRWRRTFNQNEKRYMTNNSIFHSLS